MRIDTQRVHPRGLDLRYVLTAYLHELGPLSVEQLISELTADEFELTGRPSKTISDALRWERRRGRVIRIGRGLYACLLYTSPSPRDRTRSRMPSSA